jgi:hypothetical protein
LFFDGNGGASENVDKFQNPFHVRNAGCLPVKDVRTQAINKGGGAIHAQFVYVLRVRPAEFSDETGKTPHGWLSVGAGEVIEPEPFRAAFFRQELAQNFSL